MIISLSGVQMFALFITDNDHVHNSLLLILSSLTEEACKSDICLVNHFWIGFVRLPFTAFYEHVVQIVGVLWCVAWSWRFYGWKMGLPRVRKNETSCGCIFVAAIALAGREM